MLTYNTQAMGRNLFHANRISPDGVEYDYFAVTRIPSVMSTEAPSRVSLIREMQSASPSRSDANIKSPQRTDEDSDDLVDDTELFAPRRFNPAAAAVGSGIQKRQSSPSHRYVPELIPPPLRHGVPTASLTTSMNMGSTSNAEWAIRMAQPDPIVNSALSSAAQVTRNQAAFNRNDYHFDDYEDASVPPRFSRYNRSSTGAAVGDHDHSQSTMRFLELEGGAGSAVYNHSSTGLRQAVKYGGNDSTAGADTGKFQRYDYGASFFGGHGAGRIGGNNNR